MDNAITEILKFEDLFTSNSTKGIGIRRQFLFFTILDKLTKKYHLLWSYYWEDNKDYSSLGFCLTEDSKKRIDINYSKKLDNIKIKFYNYNGKEIKAILKYIKKNNKVVDNTDNVWYNSLIK